MPTKERGEANLRNHGCRDPGARERKRRDRSALTERVRRLKNVPCADCGGTFDPVCMDFDHRPGAGKLFDLASVTTGRRHTWDEILAEVAKCDIICSNCHRIRTHRKRNHGEVCNAGRKDLRAAVGDAPPQLFLLKEKRPD